MEHVGDHDGIFEGVGGGLEPREQIARHDLRVGGVFGQQRGRRGLIAALGDRDDRLVSRHTSAVRNCRRGVG